jgi:hypothetical protein
MCKVCIFFYNIKHLTCIFLIQCGIYFVWHNKRRLFPNIASVFVFIVMACSLWCRNWNFKFWFHRVTSTWISADLHLQIMFELSFSIAGSNFAWRLFGDRCFFKRCDSPIFILQHPIYRLWGFFKHHMLCLVAGVAQWSGWLQGCPGNRFLTGVIGLYLMVLPRPEPVRTYQSLIAQELKCKTHPDVVLRLGLECVDFYVYDEGFIRNNVFLSAQHLYCIVLRGLSGK